MFNAATNEFHHVVRQGKVDAAFVVQTLDAWVATRTKPTVLVLDNASIHRAATFQARLPAWEAQSIYIFYLPAYTRT